MEFPGYNFVERIYEGTVSEIILYEHKRNPADQFVAKIVRTMHQEDPLKVKRFREQARVLERLSHPHIASFYEVDDFNGRTYAKMPYFAHGSLWKVKGRDTFKKKFRWDTVRQIALQVAQALEYAASQDATGLNFPVFHCDIKPQNIVIEQISNGQPSVVKLIDFSLDRLPDEDPLTHTRSLTQGNRAGEATIMYQSPEQALGLDDLDTRSDLFSLGMTMWALLIGEDPPVGSRTADGRPRASSLRHERKDMDFDFSILFDPAWPVDCLEILTLLLKKNRDERVKNPTELIRLLEQPPTKCDDYLDAHQFIECDYLDVEDSEVNRAFGKHVEHCYRKADGLVLSAYLPFPATDAWQPEHIYFIERQFLPWLYEQASPILPCYTGKWRVNNKITYLLEHVSGPSLADVYGRFSAVRLDELMPHLIQLARAAESLHKDIKHVFPINVNHIRLQFPVTARQYGLKAWARDIAACKSIEQFAEHRWLLWPDLSRKAQSSMATDVTRTVQADAHAVQLTEAQQFSILLFHLLSGGMGLPDEAFVDNRSCPKTAALNDASNRLLAEYIADKRSGSLMSLLEQLANSEGVRISPDEAYPAASQFYGYEPIAVPEISLPEEKLLPHLPEASGAAVSSAEPLLVALRHEVQVLNTQLAQMESNLAAATFFQEQLQSSLIDVPGQDTWAKLHFLLTKQSADSAAAQKDQAQLLHMQQEIDELRSSQKNLRTLLASVGGSSETLENRVGQLLSERQQMAHDSKTLAEWKSQIPAGQTFSAYVSSLLASRSNESAHAEQTKELLALRKQHAELTTQSQAMQQKHAAVVAKLETLCKAFGSRAEEDAPALTQKLKATITSAEQTAAAKAATAASTAAASAIAPAHQLLNAICKALTIPAPAQWDKNQDQILEAIRTNTDAQKKIADAAKPLGITSLSDPKQWEAVQDSLSEGKDALAVCEEIRNILPDKPGISKIPALVEKKLKENKTLQEQLIAASRGGNTTSKAKIPFWMPVAAALIIITASAGAFFVGKKQAPEKIVAQDFFIRNPAIPKGDLLIPKPGEYTVNITNPDLSKILDGENDYGQKLVFSYGDTDLTITEKKFKINTSINFALQLQLRVNNAVVDSMAISNLALENKSIKLDDYVACTDLLSSLTFTANPTGYQIDKEVFLDKCWDITKPTQLIINQISQDLKPTAKILPKTKAWYLKKSEKSPRPEWSFATKPDCFFDGKSYITKNGGNITIDLATNKTTFSVDWGITEAELVRYKNIHKQARMPLGYTQTYTLKSLDDKLSFVKSFDSVPDREITIEVKDRALEDWKPSVPVERKFVPGVYEVSRMHNIGSIVREALKETKIEPSSYNSEVLRPAFGRYGIYLGKYELWNMVLVVKVRDNPEEFEYTLQQCHVRVRSQKLVDNKLVYPFITIDPNIFKDNAGVLEIGTWYRRIKSVANPAITNNVFIAFDEPQQMFRSFKLRIRDGMQEDEFYENAFDALLSNTDDFKESFHIDNNTNLYNFSLAGISWKQGVNHKTCHTLTQDQKNFIKNEYKYANQIFNTKQH